MQKDIRFKVAVVAVFGNSLAIWNCIKQHVELMQAAGADVSIYIPRGESIDMIQEAYRSDIIVFSNKQDLKKKMKKNKVEVVWYPNNIVMFKYGRLNKGFKTILWIQGSDADESWMRNHSRLRVRALNFIERHDFYRANGLIHVSDSMQEFFEKKYNHHFINNAVVPCISDFHDFEPQAERIPDSYVYIGGLSKWQCFDEIVDIYSKVRTSNSVFHIITMETDKAKQTVHNKLGEANDVSVYSITDRNRIPEVLSRFQYGFLIRKESPVNFVSSPIKFLEYLSCGVNVIMTEAVPSYAKLIKKYNVGTIVDFNKLDEINVKPFSSKAREVYLKLFSREQFVEQYRNLIANALKDNKCWRKTD